MSGKQVTAFAKFLIISRYLFLKKRFNGYILDQGFSCQFCCIRIKILVERICVLCFESI